MEYIVNIAKKEETNGWIATSEDIIGLVMESETMDDLIERIKETVPEIIKEKQLEPAKAVLFTFQPFVMPCDFADKDETLYAIRDAEAGRTIGSFDSVDELMDALNN